MGAGKYKDYRPDPRGFKLRVTSAVTFDKRAGEIRFIDLDGDGVFEYMDRGGHGWQDAGLFDRAGKTIWRYGDSFGVDDMATGDLDGDGKPEFVVGFNGGGGVRLVNRSGADVWRQDDGNVWHVEMVDTDGDGTLEIVHSNAPGQITIRDRRGTIISQVSPHVPGLYLSNFSVVRWPRTHSRPSLLVPGDGKVWLLDFEGNKVVELAAPGSDRYGDIVGHSVTFTGDTAEYFAVLINYDLYDRAMLYLYRVSSESGESGKSEESDELVYEEILPEPSAALATEPSDQSGAEALLVGGTGKVWRYELKNGR